MSTGFDRPGFVQFGGEHDQFSIEPGLGTEEIQRAVITQIRAHLADEIAGLKDLWDARDRDYCAMIGAQFEPTIIPKVKDSNFYTGTKPSLVQAPLDRWPSITAFCGELVPAGDQPDHFGTLNIPIYVEVLCAAGPVEQEEIYNAKGIVTEEILDRMLSRLTDAVHLCIMRNPTLGILAGNLTPPSLITSQPFARAEEKGTGTRYIFQGRQLSYSGQKNIY